MKRLLLIHLLIALATGMAVAQFNPAQPGISDSLFRELKKTRPDTNRANLLYEIGISYIARPHEYKKDLDSAHLILDSALRLSLQIHSDKWMNRARFYQGAAYLEADDTANGRIWVMKVIDYYRKTGDKSREAGNWSSWGARIRPINNGYLDAKRHCFEQAYGLYQEIHDTLRVANALKEMADQDLNMNRLSLAERELFQVIALYKAIHYPNLHYAYHLLAAIYRSRGDSQKELFYFLECIKSVKASQDTNYMYFFYQQIGITYTKLGMTDKSLDYYKQAWAICERRSDYNNGYKLALDILDVLLPSGRAAEALSFLSTTVKAHPPEGAEQRKEVTLGFANCYAALKQPATAEKYYLEMIRLSDSLYKTQWIQTDPETYLADYGLICQFYIDAGNYRKAGYYLGKMVIPPGVLAGTRIKSDIELYSFKVDSAKGDYLSAIRHFARHKKLEDSILNVAKAQEIERLQIGYETEQKDKDLQLQSKNIQLLTKQTQLQQSQVEGSRATRNWSIAGAFMLLLLLGLGYSRYRLKQKKNIELEEKQKEISTKNDRLELLLTENEWLLREVHHRIKNNLQIIMSLLHSQSLYLRDEAALSAVLDSRHRVQSMALIHQKLYKGNNASSISMRDYIAELTEYLKDSFESSRSVYFMLEIASIKLDVVYAIPLGLIINEVVTNSLKYAFTEERAETDRITIRLTQDSADRITLYMADNGRGLPDDLDIRTNDTFGMILIRGLTEDLGAKLTIACEEGTAFRIELATPVVKKND